MTSTIINDESRKLRSNNAREKNTKDAIDVLEAFENGERSVCIVPATGIGKSITASIVWEKLGGCALYIAPKISVVEGFLSFYPQERDIIIKGITYSKLISIWKGRNAEKNADFVDFLKKTNLIILDEAHGVPAPVRFQAYNWLINVICPNAKILGMTATPRRMDQKKEESDVVDNLFNGNRIGKMSIPEAITEGILPPCKYVCFLYTLHEEIQKKIAKIRKSGYLTNEEIATMENDLNELDVNWSKIHNMESAIAEYILPKVIDFKKLGYGTKFIVFTKNIKHLKDVRQSLDGAFRNVLKNVVNVEFGEFHTLGGSVTGMNVLNDFRLPVPKNTIRILYTIDKANEGIHIDDLNGVILLRDTQSINLYTQQIGRAFSPNSLDEQPLILDMVNNIIHLNTYDTLNYRISRDGSGNYCGNGGSSEYENGFNDVFAFGNVIDAIELLSKIDIASYIKFNYNGELNTLSYFAKKYGKQYFSLRKFVIDEKLDIETAIKCAENEDTSMIYSQYLKMSGSYKDIGKRIKMNPELLKYRVEHGRDIDDVIMEWCKLKGIANV